MMFHLKKKHPTEEGALKWIQELKILRQVKSQTWPLLHSLLEEVGFHDVKSSIFNHFQAFSGKLVGINWYTSPIYNSH